MSRSQNSVLLGGSLKHLFSAQSSFISIPKLQTSRVLVKEEILTARQETERLPFITQKSDFTTRKIRKQSENTKSTNPEYQEEIKILEKKRKCERIR